MTAAAKRNHHLSSATNYKSIQAKTHASRKCLGLSMIIYLSIYLMVLLDEARTLLTVPSGHIQDTYDNTADKNSKVGQPFVSSDQHQEIPHLEDLLALIFPQLFFLRTSLAFPRYNGHRNGMDKPPVHPFQDQ
jgi:hypothetical protein